MLDKVFKPLDDKENQKRILKDLVSVNTDVNVKLIAIIRALELGHYELTEQMLSEHIINGKMSLDSKLALFFETVNSIGYHSSMDPLVDNILNKYDIDQFSVGDKYSIFGVLYQIGNIDGMIQMGTSLLLGHYDNDLQDVDMQKYIADILLETMGRQEYIDFAIETFKNDKIEGMLYTLVNAYKANANYDAALQELDIWINANPSNQRMINKRKKIIEQISIQ
jgi:hypothetical protein